MTIVIREEQRIRANRAYHQCGDGHLAPPRTHRDPVAIAYTEPGRCLLVDFYPGIRCLLFEKWHPPCLVPREVVIDYSSGREHEGVLVIRLLSRRDVGYRMKAGLAIREAKSFLVQARCARVIL